MVGCSLQGPLPLNLHFHAGLEGSRGFLRFMSPCSRPEMQSPRLKPTLFSILGPLTEGIDDKADSKSPIMKGKAPELKFFE